MTERRRIQQTQSLEDRLALEAARLRQEAKGTPPGEYAASGSPSRDGLPNKRMASFARPPASKMTAGTPVYFLLSILWLVLLASIFVYMLLQ
jgi:hypothetical protein